MARFYGWSPQLIKSLSLREYRKYLEAIGPIEAHETLLAMDTTSYPMAKDNYRDKIFKKYDKELSKMRPKKILKTTDLDNLIMSGF
jgi:hypothetical protein